MRYFDVTIASASDFKELVDSFRHFLEQYVVLMASSWKTGQAKGCEDVLVDMRLRKALFQPNGFIVGPPTHGSQMIMTKKAKAKLAAFKGKKVPLLIGGSAHLLGLETNALWNAVAPAKKSTGNLRMWGEMAKSPTIGPQMTFFSDTNHEAFPKTIVPVRNELTTGFTAQALKSYPQDSLVFPGSYGGIVLPSKVLKNTITGLAKESGKDSDQVVLEFCQHDDECNGPVVFFELAHQRKTASDQKDGYYHGREFPGQGKAVVQITKSVKVQLTLKTLQDMLRVPDHLGPMVSIRVTEGGHPRVACGTSTPCILFQYQLQGNGNMPAGHVRYLLHFQGK